MKGKKADVFLLVLSVICFLAVSASFLVMPVEGEEFINGISLLSFISGIVFWSCLVLGIVFQLILSHRRKVWFVKNSIKNSRKRYKAGLISFFKNKLSTVFDILMIVSLIAVIVAMFITQGIGYICYILISIFVFTFFMHCIFNGINFYYISNRKRMLHIIEKEKNRKDVCQNEQE